MVEVCPMISSNMYMRLFELISAIFAANPVKGPCVTWILSPALSISCGSNIFPSLQFAKSDCITSVGTGQG